MQDLAPGQRSPLSRLSLPNVLDVSLSPGPALCFVLNADARLLRPDSLVTPAKLTVSGLSLQGSRFSVNLDGLEPGVERLAFCTVPGGGLRGVNQGEISFGPANAPALAAWSFKGGDFTNEAAIIAAELYRHNGEWRVMINGQGFADGLAGLVRHFGGSGLPDLNPAPAPAPQPLPGQNPANQNPSSSGGINMTKPGSSSPAPSANSVNASRPISLTKITLEKSGQSARISLQKAGTQRVHVNLNWESRGGGAAPAPTSGGFLGKLLGSLTAGGAGKAADLDLGCMFELSSGEVGVIQALGGNFGASGQPPFIKLDQDDRTGAVAGGENLYIERPDLVRKVLIFAFIYEGAGNFSEVGGRLSFTDPQGNEIKMNLSNPASLPFCAVALVQAHGGELVITKEEKYFPGHRQCDEAYGFGFNWKAGRK
ncbi:TerD family protein [Deinococcus sp.]|uniref:TerD family protein n=1 Tax=Deinococcus sp. TaxID=47478 RepID=UPI0025F0B3A1|nr:TerD family protein [Deinococcus sp.]